jgi:ABC-type phosphate transport system substrate-binding protein
MKRSTKAILTGAALIALSGTAFAAQTDINIYGASAEFNFWKTAAKDFMTHSYGFNCTATVPSDGTPALDSTGNHGVLKGTGCTNAPTDTIVLRFSSKASYDGVFAALAVQNTNADNTCGTSSAALLNQRKMADLPTDGSHTAPSLTCQPVTVGASDIPADSFVQTSSGQLKGPNGGAVISRSFGTADLPGIDTSALANNPMQPVKVPFGFFVNTSVTAKTCTAGRVGDYCNADVDCTTKVNGTTVPGTCGTASSVINNVSREMAELLFSGQISNWSQFGPAFTAQPVVLCLRHAGSGTAATLDLAVMNHGGWGANLVSQEVATVDAFHPVQTWFNDGSGDMKYCLQNKVGSVGYLDADSGVNANTAGPLKYNGSYPSAYAIKNGVYDFWADQTVYFPDTISANQLTAVSSLLDYLNSDTGLSAAGYANFWAASSSMTVTKDAEITYPHK